MNFIKRLSLFEVLLITTILGIHLYAATADGYVFPNLWFIRDDAYYYFKVAQNISQGMGSTFDGINISNGYHPLWLLLNVPIFALARFDLILPLRVLLMVIAGLQAATAVLIYRAAARALVQPAAMLAACFWAFNGYIHFAYHRPGLETPLAAFAIAFLIERLSQFETKWRKAPIGAPQIFGLALVSALAMFSRLDLIFLAFLVGVYVIFRGHPLRFLLPLDIAAVFFSVTAAVALRVEFPAYNHYAASAVTATLVALPIKIIVFYFSGMYQHPNASGINVLWKSLLANGIGAALFSGVMLALGTYPRAALLYDFALALALTLGLRLLARRAATPRPAPSGSPVEELRARALIWLREGTIFYGTLGGLLGAYMLINKIIFGTSSPVSGQIKRWWGTLLHTVYDTPAANWRDFLGIGYDTAYNVWQPLSQTWLALAIRIKPLYPGSNTTDERYYIIIAATAVLLALLVFFLPRQIFQRAAQMSLLPLLAGNMIHTLSYTATAYGGAKEWYWAGETLLMIYVGALLLDLALRPLMKFAPLRVAAQAGALALGAVMLSALLVYFRAHLSHGRFPPDKPYMEVVAYLEEHTPPGTVIGMTGGGNVGYFIKDRTITNMDGLINSYEYFRVLQAKGAPQYLHQRGMRVVFSNKKILEYPPYDKQFTPYLSAFGVYGGKDLMWLLPEPKY
ncbi:MAG: hypothetical protein Fur002_16420 [Anaerolineales bacterium]